MSNSELTTIDTVSYNNETLFNYVENETTIEINNNDTTDYIIKYPILDDGFLLTFIIIVAIIGILGNAIILCILFRQKLTGIYSLLFQLSCIDIFKICFLTYPEVWSLNNGSWIFTSELCPIYLGVEVIAGTIVTYLIVLINLHIITIWNINKKNVKEILEDTNNPLTRNNCYDRLPSPNTKKNTLRSVTFKKNKYKANKITLSTLFPLIIIWTLAISLSIPMFGLSTTVVTKNNGTFCTIVDMQHFSTMQIILCITRIIIPYTILLLTIISLILKLLMKKYLHIVDNQNKNSIKVKYYVIFGIILTIFHILLSTKSIFIIQHTVTTKYVTSVIDKMKMPPLQNLVSTPKIHLVFSMIYYALTAFRFILYFILPVIRKLICGIVFKTDVENKNEN